MRSARSERQQNVEQDRVWRLAAVGLVELFQTLARKQHRGRGIEHDVLREQRPVLYRRRNVRAQVAVDIALIAENRQHGGVGEPELIQVADDAPPRRNIEVGADSNQRHARIGEVRLPLILRRAKAGEDAVTPRQRDATATDQRHCLANPETGVGTGDLRILEYRVEASLLAVVRILVAGCVKRGTANAEPIEVARYFAHAVKGADVRRLLRGGIAVVASYRVVQRGSGVPATEMAVARGAEIGHVVLVRPGVAENGGADLKTVFVAECFTGFPGR